MPENAPAASRIAFANFEVDLESQELFRQGAVVRVPNQSFLALAALLERPGQLVTREELRARLWPDKRVVEFEQGLNAIINRLREALGDNAENPVFIETLPRRGYRFVGSIARDAESAAPAPAASAAADPVLSLRATLVLVAVLALAVAAFLALRSREPPTRAASVAPLTTLVGQERMPALSPDGTRVVFAWDGKSAAGGVDLYARSLDSERLTQLTHAPAAGLSASWSPDGTRIAFARMGGANPGVFVMPATGVDERKLADASFTQESLMQPSWSPDGETLAFSAVVANGSHHIRMLTIADGSSRALDPSPGCWHAGAPAFSPDGDQLAFVCITSIAVYGVYVVGADGGKPRELAKRQGFPQGLAWAADGKRLLIANDSGDGGGIWELELDGTLHAPRVAEESVGAGLSARDGRLVYTRARQVIDIWHVNAAEHTPAEPPRKWIFSTRAQLTPQYSPDGLRIAFQSNRSGSPEIWLSDADGANAVRLTTFNGPLTGGPSWCADGRRLAFDSRESGVSAVYVVDTLERVPRRVQTAQRNLALPVWSADCRWLLASDGREAMYRVPVDGGAAQRFTTQRSYQAAIVGRRVIFNVAEPTGVTLWSKPFDGGEETLLHGMPRLSYADGWAANNQGIFFIDSSRVPVALRRYDFATASVREIATLPHSPTALGGLGLAVSRDGTSLLYTHTEDMQSDLVLAGFQAGR